ncbi:biotin synthase auxiliary protein BsaP [Actinosynnema sp. ALI-1.44]|uniref:biotin synthase auxiliary protein BsaP n=1 Tax=Actinosynnema sp. ALI-1.44 TaxID=1933779 RepID=UPI0011778CBE
MTYCGWCGKPGTEGVHEVCRKRLALVDPPRFCRHCARRMVVQVTPAGWSARCSRHGESTSAPVTG